VFWSKCRSVLGIISSSKDVLETYQLGSKSNISRLKKTLVEKEIIEEEGDTITLADPIFELWFKREYM
jgi:hypothetical protein